MPAPTTPPTVGAPAAPWAATPEPTAPSPVGPSGSPARPDAAAPSPQGGGRFGAFIALLGAGAAIAGAFLPWLKITPSWADAFSIGGWNLSMDAKIIAGIGGFAVIVAVVVLGGAARRPGRVLIAIAGIALIGIGGYDTYDLVQRLPDALTEAGVAGIQLAAPGLGLILVMVGGGVALLGALAMVGDRSPDAGGVPGQATPVAPGSPAGGTPTYPPTVGPQAPMPGSQAPMPAAPPTAYPQPTSPPPAYPHAPQPPAYGSPPPAYQPPVAPPTMQPPTAMPPQSPAQPAYAPSPSPQPPPPPSQPPSPPPAPR
ncbi:MAG: hypothetical protein JST73_08580 [Actinobacteria bacterium]|nr:hypothetical protein [Actinomycetota bacterium]